MTGFKNPVITVKKGLDVPLAGAPIQEIESAPPSTHVALLGEEYVGLKPSMMVEVGDKVRKGQALFQDKKNPGVTFTAPASGVVSAINRGKKRVLQSVVIEQVDIEQPPITFNAYDDVTQLSREQVVTNLVNSGLWTALRTRPFSRTPKLDESPIGIFVTAIDTNPLSTDPKIVINEQKESFVNGLKLLTHLTEGKVYLCQDDKEILPGEEIDRVEIHPFNGVHPAGNVGTHIHFLLPVDVDNQVWHIGYQDVIAYGKLFETGELYTDRVVSFAGPQVANPRLIRTQIGAELLFSTKGELKPGLSRVVSGSVLSGHTAKGAHRYLGRFHNQVTVLDEGFRVKPFAWLRRNSDRFSITRAVSSFFKDKEQKFDMTTQIGGSARAMMAYGQLDRVMPLDILPTLLVRDLVVRDTDEAQALGALELDEEDLALCTFVCPSKYDFGRELRACLDIIEREG